MRLRLMVASGVVGQNWETTQHVEVVDLDGETTCQDLPDYPLNGLWPVGFINRKDQPEICGGYGIEVIASAINLHDFVIHPVVFFKS